MNRVIGIIPARYGSTRFPGKPLHLIAGKSLIQRTWEQVVQSHEINRVIVATDDQKILEHVESFGGEAVMTSSDCATGTDRIAEVVRSDPMTFEEVDIVVNIQGDEPCIEPETIDRVIHSVGDLDLCATAVTRIKNPDELHTPSVVKCVVDQWGDALYFSRLPLPGAYRHVGIYAFDTDFLLEYSQLADTPLQKAENLEQLKILEHGNMIKVAVVEESGIGVDVPEDVEEVEEWLKK